MAGGSRTRRTTRGSFEVYVRPFPDVTSGKWQVSTDGGTRPLWARNGQELFYLAPDGALMRVPWTRGTTWAAATPTKLFEGAYYRGGGANALADVRRVARRQAVSDDQAGRLRRTSRAGQHRRRSELARGAEAPRADEIGSR